MKTRPLVATLTALCLLVGAGAVYVAHTAHGAAAAWQFTATTNETVAEQRYRALWEYIVQKPGASDLDFALAVNDHIHRNVPFGSTGDVPGDVPHRLTNALLGGGERAICGDYSVFLQMVLQASGIPARTVQLASAKYAETGDPLAPTHVTVEALIEDRWILVDPTFDATFSCEGDPKLIGVEEARQCPKLVYNQHPGTLPDPERSVASHPFNFPDLLAYSATAPTEVDGKPVKWFGYPDDDWLPKAQAMQEGRATASIK